MPIYNIIVDLKSDSAETMLERCEEITELVNNDKINVDDVLTLANASKSVLEDVLDNFDEFHDLINNREKFDNICDLAENNDYSILPILNNTSLIKRTMDKNVLFEDICELCKENEGFIEILKDNESEWLINKSLENTAYIAGALSAVTEKYNKNGDINFHVSGFLSRSEDKEICLVNKSSYTAANSKVQELIKSRAPKRNRAEELTESRATKKTKIEI